MGLFYPSNKGFLLIYMQNVSGKAIRICLVPILVGVIIMMAISALRPLQGLAPINKVEEVLIHIRFDIVHCYKECAFKYCK